VPFSPELREFAETPGPFLEVAPGGIIDRHTDGRVCITQGPTFAFVTAPRVDEGEVAELLAEVRERVSPDKNVEWFIGPSARPAGIVGELKALGVRDPRDGTRLLHALALDSPPLDPPPGIEARELETFEEYVAAAELRLDAFDVPLEDRERERALYRSNFEAYGRVRGRSSASFVATIDGRVAGAAAGLLSPRGVFLIGGATAPWARRRGVYRSLVRARWDYAVARGTPSLAVHAKPDSSYPILRRVGFAHLCDIECLEGLGT